MIEIILIIGAIWFLSSVFNRMDQARMTPVKECSFHKWFVNNQSKLECSSCGKVFSKD